MNTCVRMEGIQNNIIIYQNAFIIHNYGLHLYKGKLFHVLSEYITSSINFNMGSLGGTTNIQTIFNFVPRCLKNVWRYRSHIVPYTGFQVLKVADLNLLETP
jgi:hypothetical protein